MILLQSILSLLILVSAGFSVYYSIRYRRMEGQQRGIYNARLNIAMGVMLLVIAITQLFFFTDSNTRRIFGTTCLLLGLFNLFVGLRNHGLLSRFGQKTTKK